MKYPVDKIRNVEAGKINRIYIPRTPGLDLNELVLLDGRHAFKFDFVEGSSVLLSKIQREFLNKSLGGDEVSVKHLDVIECDPISLLKLDMEVIGLEKVELDAEDLSKKFKETHALFPFNKDQKFYFYMGSTGFKVCVREMFTTLDKGYGILLENTDVFMSSICDRLVIQNSTSGSMLLDPGFDFEFLGIGGLKQEFGVMFRRAFVQRMFSADVIKRFGVQHVKGMILYGPPGTGKTLIARKICSSLNTRPPKIVNGPEVLNKYVGQSEENIRNLFRDAEDEWRIRKEDSCLHIIIFDEIDAICKSRGNSGSTGVGDQVVNQLLSKMDGVESLDNVLVIGTTNRLDLIDEALLRPGRFEVHLEISLPDEQSRAEIFRIHTKTMASNDYLDENVDLNKMAKISRNYTGAEIAGVVKSAASFALERKIRHKKKDGEDVDASEEKCMKVHMGDFMKAIEEVRPSFGTNDQDFYKFEKVFYETSMFTQAIEHGRDLLLKLRVTNLYNTSSLLFYGDPGVGKTTLAVKAARASTFPFIKIISPKDIIEFSEHEKVNYIRNKFMDAYKSEEAIIILDDIEGLIEFVNIGPRFSTRTLQALKTFIKEEGRKKVFVFGTTSFVDVMMGCGIYECFQSAYEVERIGPLDYKRLCEQNHSFAEIEYEKALSIKKLISFLKEPDVSPQ